MRVPAIATLCLALATVGAACRSEGPAGDAARSPEGSTAEAPPPASRVSFAVDECKFDTFAPAAGATLSTYSKALMYKLGTAILGQPNGSLAKLACPQGEAFPGWVDTGGAAESALHGVSWQLVAPWFSPGQSAGIELWETRDGEWWKVGRFEDVTVDGKTYTTFYGPVSAPSQRLLRYFGIALDGQESQVRVLIGDRSATGVRGADGNLRVTDTGGWSEPTD